MSGAALGLFACGGGSTRPLEASSGPTPAAVWPLDSSEAPSSSDGEDSGVSPIPDNDQAALESAAPTTGLWVTFSVQGEKFRSLATRCDTSSGGCRRVPLHLYRASRSEGTEDTWSEEALAATLNALSRDIRLMASDRACSSNADCATIGFGAKACGGPSEYLIYSALRVNTGSLKKQVDRYNKLDRRLNELRGTVSTCDYREPPQVSCKNQVCMEVAPR